MADFFECECMAVRGYHKYKDVWEAEVATTLQCQRQSTVEYLCHYGSEIRSSLIVGHVPNKYRPLAH